MNALFLPAPSPLADRRMDEWNDFPLATPIDPEVGKIGGDHGALRVSFTGADQAQIREN